MKRKWFAKKLTFLIIPEVHRSVIRFKIPNPILYFIPVVVLTTLSTLVILYLLHMNSLEFNQKLQIQLSAEKTEFLETVASKDQTIELLQNDVITLSHQADEIKDKVIELQELENEIKGITEPIASKDNIVNIASFAEENELSTVHEESVGGNLIPAKEEDIIGLALSTESDFKSLNLEMDQLFNSLSVAKEKIIEYQEHLRITPSIWPTLSKRVTSNFGYRSDPFTRKPSLHSGIDIGGDRKDPIYATADGVVVTSGYDRGLGNHVIIDHSGGIRTVYMHMTKTLVDKGDKVEKGTEIGLLGSTGRSTGPHLHYEVHKDGKPIDPRPYM